MALEQQAGSPRAATAVQTALSWVALAAAFSPVLVQLGQHVAAEPWARYCLVFPVLLAWCLAHEPGTAPSKSAGFALLAIGVLGEFFALSVGLVREARLALPVAVVGMCRLTGVAPYATALLASWMIPVPHGILVQTPEGPLRELFRAATELGNLLGGHSGLEGAQVVGERGRLRITGTLGPLPLVALLSGLAWYAALRLGRSWKELPLYSAGAGLLSLPLYFVAATVAVRCLSFGSDVAHLALGAGLWIPVTAAVVAFTELRVRRRGPG